MSVTEREYRSVVAQLDRARDQLAAVRQERDNLRQQAEAKTRQKTHDRDRQATARLHPEHTVFETFARCWLDLLDATDPTPPAVRTGGEPPDYPSQRVSSQIRLLKDITADLEDLASRIEAGLHIPIDQRRVTTTPRRAPTRTSREPAPETDLDHDTVATVMSRLAAGPAERSELAKLLGVSGRQARRALTAMARQKLVTVDNSTGEIVYTKADG